MVGSTTKSTLSPRKGYCSLLLLPEEGDRVALLHIKQHLWLTVRSYPSETSSETASGEYIVIHGWSLPLVLF